LDGKSVFAFDATKPKTQPRRLLKVEFNPTRVSTVDSAASMQGSRSPDGKWAADLDRWQKLVLRDAHDPTRTKALGNGGVMEPTWSPDSRYLVLEKWQWRCGVNFDVEVPETLEILDTRTRKRSTVQSSRCKVQFGVNGFVSSDIVQ
jgi:WD40-like Beta Propeller Repeat